MFQNKIDTTPIDWFGFNVEQTDAVAPESGTLLFQGDVSSPSYAEICVEKKGESAISISLVFQFHRDTESNVEEKYRNLKEVSTFIIENYIKVKKRMGIELAGAWDELEASEILEEVRSENLLRQKIPVEYLYKSIHCLLEMFPHIEWDSESLSDALFCNPNNIDDFFHQVTLSNKNETTTPNKGALGE
jgi:hypothetical protein